MYTAKIQNRGGDLLILTGDEPVYQIVSITGLNPPRAQVNTTAMAGLDGARYNSAKLNTRNIVITVRINGDVETNRLRLYRYFRTKEWCTFFYANGSVDVQIDGYVEAVECDLFSMAETAQISILCPQPYFRSISEMVADSSAVFSVFCFPFSINIGEPVQISTTVTGADGAVDVYNGSESEAGVTVEVLFSAAAESLEIKNTSSGEYIKLIYDFLANDQVTINTNKGSKSITLIRDGEISNIFPALTEGSAFFQLIVGNNHFEYLLDNEINTEDVELVFRWYTLYRGV